MIFNAEYISETITVSPRINVHALIFEDALSFRKLVHARIFEHKHFKKKACTYTETWNDLDKKYFNIKKSNESAHLFCNDNVVRITLLIHYISIEMCIIYPDFRKTTLENICNYYIIIDLVTRCKIKLHRLNREPPFQILYVCIVTAIVYRRVHTSV